jgi:hypothetical protein
MINEKIQVMDRSEFVEILMNLSTGSGPFLRFHKQSGISPWPNALNKKRAYIGVGPFRVEMAARNRQYSNRLS